MAEPTVPQQAVDFWQSLLDSGAGHRHERASWPGRDTWIATLTPALVESLVPGSMDAEPLRENRLYGRFQQAVQTQALGWIAEAGIDCVVLKGFAAAFLYYPEPAARLIGDLDLLVRRRDLPRLIEALTAHGFGFGGLPDPAWGFLSDASFLPFHSADGNCNLDLHVEPDSYPLHLGLDVDSVFAQARQVMAGERMVAAPCAEHMALIVVSNLAKDKFAPNGLRKLLDLARLLDHEKDFDWAALRDTAARARLSRALATTLGLLRALGTPAESLPPDSGIPRGATFAGLLRDWIEPRDPTLLQRLRREWVLAADPAIAARLAVRRVAGLVRPRSGLPKLPG